MQIEAIREYEEWFLQLTPKQQAQVMKRMSNIRDYDHLGDFDHVGNKLYELRWRNGWRVYFMKNGNTIYLLVGGHKNGQESDIKKAKIIMGRYTGH